MNKTLFLPKGCLWHSLFYKRFPQFLSIILNPLLMPTIGIYLILNSGTHISLLLPEAKNIILIITASGTFGLPIAFIPFLYHRKIITSFDISEKNERIIPLVITSFLYYLSFFLLHQMVVPILIQAFLFASTIAVVLTLLVTIKWKISAHLVGIGGIMGLIITVSVLYHVNMFFYLMLFSLLAGFIGFARLSLNKHTPAQVYLGFISGLVVMVVTLILFHITPAIF